MSIPICVDDHPWHMSRSQMFLLLCLVVLALVAVGSMTAVRRLARRLARSYRTASR